MHKNDFFLKFRGDHLMRIVYYGYDIMVLSIQFELNLLKVIVKLYSCFFKQIVKSKKPCISDVPTYV